MTRPDFPKSSSSSDASGSTFMILKMNGKEGVRTEPIFIIAGRFEDGKVGRHNCCAAADNLRTQALPHDAPGFRLTG
ncbi:hypothetical protein EU803_03220 [Loktanella sp. IMCC34160]|uniref:hypothetical protein n=1 Tax=Loktanella sp. IMCC34160 TaxID=2510646 RepID=UPI00101D0080|nr:hypothetical protein [Loktanella sp. IMCC34160]RYG93130.1 hypothetical protein EU803_03220 [Loktanella sp. IMCC34160]